MADAKAGAVPVPGPPPGPPPRPLPENPLLGTSNKQPAVTGNSNTNIGVLGQSVGAQGGAPATDGVFGLGQNGVHGQAYFPGGSGVLGESYLGLNGVHGKSATAGGTGVLGEYIGPGSGDGVLGLGQNGVHGRNSKGNPNHPVPWGMGTGVWGECDNGLGVYGATNSEVPGAGVLGINSGHGPGVVGEGQGEGVRGVSHSPDYGGVVGVNDNSNATNGFGVYGESYSFEGVRGVSHNPNHGGVVGLCLKPNGIGVYGFCDDGTRKLPGTGVFGESSLGEGVHGVSHSRDHGGVVGMNDNPSGNFSIGVYGWSQSWEGVHGDTMSAVSAGVCGIMLNPQGTGAGVYGESRGLGPAGYFKGNLVVTGDVTLINQDCAEDFNISGAAEIEPGTVMVIQEGDVLQMSQCPYDKRVAGVISGAGNLKPAVVLGKQSSQDKRMPLALLGKVYCKVDAGYSAVEVGDLLTTSPTAGHAMKAADPNRAFGAVIGKALQPLAEGRGLIPILIALQ